MAKNMQPVLKRCRTLGVSPAAMGYNDREAEGQICVRHPGEAVPELL